MWVSEEEGFSNGNSRKDLNSICRKQHGDSVAGAKGPEEEVGKAGD